MATNWECRATHEDKTRGGLHRFAIVLCASGCSIFRAYRLAVRRGVSSRHTATASSPWKSEEIAICGMQHGWGTKTRLDATSQLLHRAAHVRMTHTAPTDLLAEAVCRVDTVAATVPLRLHAVAIETCCFGGIDGLCTRRASELCGGAQASRRSALVHCADSHGWNRRNQRVCRIERAHVSSRHTKGALALAPKKTRRDPCSARVVRAGAAANSRSSIASRLNFGLRTPGAVRPLPCYGQLPGWPSNQIVGSRPRRVVA